MSRPHRLDSACYVGFQRYYLTICTCQRRHWFTSEETVARTLWHFLRTAAEESFEILVYCFMPDHVHIVVEALRADADVRRLVSRGKQYSGFAHGSSAGRRLWQEGYYERVVRSDQDLPTLAAYVADNSRRAGLVKTPAEYPYWGSQVYTREEILEFLMFARRP